MGGGEAKVWDSWVLLHCGALSKAQTCWKRLRFQALDAAASYFNLFGLFCPSSSTMQLAQLESLSLTEGEGDFQGYVYTFFLNSSVNSLRLALTFAKPYPVMTCLVPVPFFSPFCCYFLDQKTLQRTQARGLELGELASPSRSRLQSWLPGI